MEELPDRNVDVDDDGDSLTLSSQALTALQEFLREQSLSPAEQSEVALVTEDWRPNQFWYERETAETVANEVLALCSGSPSRVACIACITCPTLYAYLKRIDPSASVQLLEYDKRFEQYGSDFTFYDYNPPEELPTELKHAFQVIVAYPPYLEKFKRVELQNYLVCIHAYSGLSISASLGMSFAYSPATMQGRDWEDGSK